MNINLAINEGSKILNSKFIPNPLLDAEILMAKIFNKDRNYILLNYSNPINKNDLNNLIFFILVCLPLQGEEVKKTYIVKVGAIKIGELVWEMNLTTNNYSNKLKLRSKGLLSGLYSFKGDYFSEGIKNKNELFSTKYTHFWQTKKNIKKMGLVFKNNKLVAVSYTHLTLPTKA